MTAMKAVPQRRRGTIAGAVRCAGAGSASVAESKGEKDGFIP
ncbi:hypothetical protein [Azoarcus sp. TTM-91]|nr:hypothetical protein [Azoarcus sp. TTM-91]